MKAVILDAASLGPDVDLDPIRQHLDTLDVHDHTPRDRAAERLAGAEVAIVNKVVLDAHTLEALPALKLICVLATGTNNIDMSAADRLGISVKNVTAYGTASVAQHTLMLILALATRLPLYQRDVARGRWNESPFFCLMEHATLQLEGKRLVIVGQGELGSKVARLAQAFGMHVDFAARPGNEAHDSRPGLRDLAPEADVDPFFDALTLPIRAPSLGGVESLITQPIHTSHASMPPADREALGITERFVRLSVGLEGAEDLTADLTSALQAARG